MHVWERVSQLRCLGVTGRLMLLPLLLPLRVPLLRTLPLALVRLRLLLGRPGWQ